MTNPIKRKKRKTSTARNKNVNRIVSVKRGLRQPKIVKSNFRCKVSNTEIKDGHFQKRKKSMKRTQYRNIEEHSVLKKSRKSTSKKSRSLSFFKNAMTKKNNLSNKINALQRQISLHLHQNKASENGNSLKAYIKSSKNFNISCSSSPVFVCLGNIDEEKRCKNKFRKPANGRELKRLRQKLWNKSSYHKRFLGKRGIIRSRKTEKKKNEVVNEKGKCMPPRKGDPNLQKFQIKNSTDITVPSRKKNLEQRTNERSDPDDSGTKGEAKINVKIQSLRSNKSSKEDVSKVDKNYIKSLLIIANCSTEPENEKVKQHKGCSGSKAENENRVIMTEKEFLVRNIKNKTNHELNWKNMENKIDDVKIQQKRPKEKNNVISILRDATKSETQIKLRHRKSSDIKNKEIRNETKKAYSKHEINSHQQKTKTRNIVKKKIGQNIEVPFPCGVLKTEDIQVLWRRENLGKSQNSQSTESSSTIVANDNNQNVKGLGMQSYQILKRFVEEEIYRISHKYNKNSVKEKQNKTENDAENAGKDTYKQSAGSNENLLPDLMRKRPVKSKESFPVVEIQFRKSETLNLVNVVQRGKLENLKSKLKLVDEKKRPNAKIADEIIENWSIVNRLEQAFLALGTPDFRKIKAKEPATTNTKGMRTIEKNTVDIKKVDKMIKDGEKNQKKPATQTAFNKRKNTETSKSFLNEKQLSVLQKKESTINSRKQGTPSLVHPTKSTKPDGKTKPKEEKARLQPPIPPQPCKPVIKPTVKLTSQSGMKPQIHAGNLWNSRNKIQNSRQIGKFGKKNSSKPHLCESSKQNKNDDDDNLERKKTFHIISLKDSVIMQPRRSKSCNKIDRNSEVDRKNSSSSTQNEECKDLNIFNKHEQNIDFWDFFNKTEQTKGDQELKDKEIEADQQQIPYALETPKSKNIAPTSERSRGGSEESMNEGLARTLNEGKKSETAAPSELSEQVQALKDINCSSKERPAKERSILSIRMIQHEKQTSRTNVCQIQECKPIIFQTDSLDIAKTEVEKDVKKTDSMLPSTKANHSETSWLSTGTYDLTDQVLESSIKNVAPVTGNTDELELLKTPSLSSSKSMHIISSQILTDKGELKTGRTAPWEQDINYYRALVRDIMSQYNRLDGFLKQSEDVKNLPEGSEELKTSSEEIHVLKEELNIEDYRRKIVMEYEELPIFEYKSKMKEIQEKSDGKSKRRKLLVVQTANTELDLDIKDYEPRMRTVLGERLYFDKENFTKRQEINKNSKEKKSSLQEVILCKNTKSENCSRAISTPRICL